MNMSFPEEAGSMRCPRSGLRAGKSWGMGDCTIGSWAEVTRYRFRKRRVSSSSCRRTCIDWPGHRTHFRGSEVGQDRQATVDLTRLEEGCY